MASAAAAAALPGGVSAAAASKAAATAGVGGLAWGKFAWGYSRSLFAYDAGFRFERMCAGYEFANSQQEMFRADLNMMTELTCRKMGVYTVVGTMGNAIFIAIFCAGRLGLHGPSPPVWIMGLFLTNIAASFAYSGLGIWLAFHAMWRAKAACLHLNTRKIRLLIPTRKKLDEARKYNNQWEHQNKLDLLRVPYISDAMGWKFSGEVPDVSDDDEHFADYTENKGRSSSAPPTRRKRTKRVPCWIQEEYEQDRVGIAGGSGNDGLPEDAAPEHFRLYQHAQKEWFQHDCYARVCFFYAFLSFFQGGSFYSLGQIAVELRAWWPMFAANFIFTMIHFLMLTFDIVKPLEPQEERLPYCQYFGTLTIPVAAIGMALDFRVEYWDVAIQLTWFCIFVCHICQIIYSARLIELIIPKVTKKEDQIGGNIWPAGWEIPPFFSHVYYFVSPPERLRPGQFDTVRELKHGYYAKGGSSHEEDGYHAPDDATKNLEELFRLIMLTDAWHRLSKGAQDQVSRLRRDFDHLATRRPSNETRNELGQLERQLLEIKQTELSGKDSGYGSDGGYSSGSGSDGSGSSSGYSSGGGDGYKAEPRYHPDSHEFTKFSYASPAKLVFIITAVFFLSWCFLTFAMIIDRITGVQGLVTAPHWAKPPMTRSSHYPWERGTPLGFYYYMTDHKPTPEELYWHENNKPKPQGWHPHWMSFGHESSGGKDRRLTGTPFPTAFQQGLQQEGMRKAFTSLVSSLPTPAVATELLQRVPTQEEAFALTSLESRFRHSAGLGWQPKAYDWPGFFEPKLLAVSSTKDGMRHALAITPRGVAAAANLAERGGEAERFMLTGISDYPPLLAASWAPGPKEGLMLVSKMGDLLHCPGARQGARWSCGPLANAPPRVPLPEGARLTAAATAWLPLSAEPSLHAAVILASSPDVVALWALEGNTEAASWLPLGELPVPSRMSAGATVSFVNDGEILVATKDGATIQRKISDGSVVGSTPVLDFAADKESSVQWQSACGVHGGNGGVVHLSMRQQGKSMRPEVMVLRMSATSA
jgi:uncharacterized membrane protein YgcG